MKDVIAANGKNIAAIRKAFESNDNDAITKALNDLDTGQAALASIANNTGQHDQRAGEGNVKATDRVAAGFGKGQPPQQQPVDKAAPQKDKA